MSSLFTDLRKKCLKQYVEQTVDIFRYRQNNYKINDRKFQRSEPSMQEQLFRHFSSLGHNGFLNDLSMTFIDKTDSSIPLNVKIFGEKHLWLWRLMGLILKIVSEFYHFDNITVIIDTFYSAQILHFMDYWNGLLFRVSVMENEFVQSLFY